jgi:replicative DNA helicase
MSVVVDLGAARAARAVLVEPDTERALCGCALFAAEAVDEVANLVASDDFGDPRARLVWDAITRLHARAEPVDLLTLRNELASLGTLQRVGDDYVLAVTEWVPTVEGAEHYARRIRRLARARAVLAAARRIEAAAAQPIEDLDAFVADAETAVVTAARSRAESRGPVAMKDALIETFEEITEAANAVNEGRDPGDAIGTRFPRFDRMLGGGARPGNVIIIAGRPGMGKTAIGLDIALSLRKGPGIFYELEMSRGELVRRALSNEGRVDGGRIRTAKLGRDEWNRLTSAAGMLTNLGFYVDDTPAVTLSYIRATARRQKAREGLAWILIDYVNLMRSDDRGISREEQVASTSRGLKGLAKELEVPVYVLAQLNRKVEDRGKNDRRPQLADLRESGSLEQDADIIAFVYREELYRPDDDEVRGLGELIVAKQRSGPTGTVHMRYLKEYTRFEELADDRGPMPSFGGLEPYEPDRRLPDDDDDDWSDP